MYKTVFAILMLLISSGLWAQSAAPEANNDAQQLRQEIDQMKKSIETMEERLAAQEKAAQEQAAQEKAAQPAAEGTVSTADIQARVNDLDERVTKTETRNSLNRLNWSGDIRVENNSIFANIPTHYDGMQLQNLLVKTMWLASPPSQGGLGLPINPAALPPNPNDYANMIKGALAANYGSYQYFTNNVTFAEVKGFFGSFSPSMQAAFLSYLQGVTGVKVNHYGANANELATNRLRLNLDAHPSDNVEVVARLSMYKAFGDSTGVQVFNGQPTSLNIDGTTTRVPNGDYLRVERAYFTWKNILGIPGNLYLSIGRRPSTDGPPLNYREDEPRGGTPSATLINYQFDGVTVGYHLGEKTTLRACYGLGFDSGFGNGQNLMNPADRVKGVQFLGSNIDAYATEKSLVQITIARAWNVTDGFNGLMVLPNNPLTGDPINAPVVLRFTPDANVGAINLYGVVAQHTVGDFDLYASANWDSLRPNGVTTPFGGLGSNPFDTPRNHEGHMIYAGFRYNVPQDHARTKIGFEFNQGSKYWFNFAQAEDDIFAPKTSARGEVYESFITHRITNHFIVKGDYQRFHYKYSGSGWDVGAPEQLSSSPVLGFPTYDRGTLITAGLQARF
jgi:hypothetical protein